MARVMAGYKLEGLWVISVAPLDRNNVFHFLGYCLNIVKALVTGNVPSALC